MNKEKIITESEATENPVLGMTVEGGESELKEFLVNYTGTKLDEEQVTVQMIADVLAAEFPALDKQTILVNVKYI